MLIDCDSCTARPHACGDCIVTHLLQVGPVRGRAGDDRTDPWETSAVPGPGRWSDATADDGTGTGGGRETGVDAWLDAGADGAPELTDSEVAAVAVLSAGGLVPPLRLVTPTRRPSSPPASPAPGTSGTSAAGRTGGRGPRRRTG